MGDDRHGWSHLVCLILKAVVMLCIKLSEQNEPVIYHAIGDNAIMENVFLNEQGIPTITMTATLKIIRCAYPLQPH